MRIRSGDTDKYVYFVAVDSTDLKTRKTGLTGFTVYRSRNGAAAAAMTTPTINETDSTNMPGVYELLADEDTTIAAANEEEEMVFHISATGMNPLTRAITLFRGMSAGYVEGRIWIDTGASNTNTVDHVDGTIDNPVSTWAAALTLAGSLGFDRFGLMNGSSITLSGASDNYDIKGYGATVALGSQSVAGTVITGATVTGNDDGTNTTRTRYEFCTLGTSSLGKHEMYRCKFTGNITLAEAGDYFWDSCRSFVADQGTPDVTFSSGNQHLNVRDFSGGIQINSMATGDTMSFEARGQFKIAATCTGGSASLRGPVGPITDLASGNVTLTENARIADDTINAEVVDALNVDTYAEPGQEAPPATASLAYKINYSYKLSRNKKTQTSSLFSLYNDAGDTVDQKATISDSAGTATVEETVTGP